MSIWQDTERKSARAFRDILDSPETFGFTSDEEFARLMQDYERALSEDQSAMMAELRKWAGDSE